MSHIQRFHCREREERGRTGPVAIRYVFMFREGHVDY